jgi:RNA polymerase sigma factor (sigma-70 family)
VSPASWAPPDSAAVQPASAVSPAVTPGLASVPGSVSPGSLVDGLAATFRITRTPASATTLEVRYTVTGYGSAGAAGRDGVATISPGAGHVDVPIEPTTTARGGGPEIVTLTLRDAGPYQIAQPSATLFLAGNARLCSDAALFEAYRQGQSGEAFRVLVERHRPAVLRACYRILGNWADAEDVSQVVLLALARRPVGLPALLAGWLSTVAHNAAIAFLRSRNRRSRHERRAAKPLQGACEDDSHDQREELDAALTRLPAPLREAVRLRYLEGLSQREAAQVVGCPRGTLSQRAANGVRCLRGILGGNNGAPRA